MKNFIYRFLFLSVIILSSYGFSYGMDCSVYDDLINTIETQINNLKMTAQRESNGHYAPEQIGQVLANSKYADEYNSLIAEYNSALQQKEECLSNTTSSSNTNTYNNYQSNSNTHNKSQDQLCKEAFGNYSIAIGDDCGCKNGYGWDSPEMNYCITMENSCKGRFGDNATSSGDECLCKTGFILNESLTKCVLDSSKQRNLNCSTFYSGHAHAEGNECFCDDGYTLNEEKNKCVKDTIDQRKLNCPARYGTKSFYSKDGDVCLCADGYIMNEDKTQCVKATKNQRELSCTARYNGKAYYSEIEDSCVCNDGYVFVEEYGACLINLNQKSLQSRIINTKDAKCDSTDVIAACKLEPTKDSCPAVCLELYDAINWMYNNGLSIYNQPTNFGIYNEITREQASKFFVNFYTAAFNKTPVVSSNNPFNDINNADPTLYDYILKANVLGLFKGSNGKFMPFNHLTKAQAIAVIIRMATGLLDESQNPRYSNYLYKAESMKLLNNINYSYNTLDNENIVRGDVALILYRLYEYLNSN